MSARRLRLYILGASMSCLVLRLRRGRKIRKRCGRLCARCERWIGRLVSDGYGSTKHESQSPHPVAQSATRVGHPRFVFILVFSFTFDGAGAFWSVWGAVCS